MKEQLESEAPGKKLIFNKDMVEGIVGKYDALPDGFRHVFLLRHPLKVNCAVLHKTSKQISKQTGKQKTNKQITTKLQKQGQKETKLKIRTERNKAKTSTPKKQNSLSHTHTRTHTLHTPPPHHIQENIKTDHLSWSNLATFLFEAVTPNRVKSTT